MISKKRAYFWAVFRNVCCVVAATLSAAQAQSAAPVSGCKLLRNPSRYNGKMVIIKGRYTSGFERSDVTFECPGSIRLQLSLNPTDRSKYGFLTEQASLNGMSQLPAGEHPGDNLTARKLRYALVTVVGLFKCRYDFPTCKGASPDDGSIVVKSVQLDTPMTDSPPVLKPNASGNALLHE